MEMREIPEGKQTVTGEGRDLVSAIQAAAEALGVEPQNVGYKLDLAHFRSQLGGMVAKQTVKIIGWVEEGGAHLDEVVARPHRSGRGGERHEAGSREGGGEHKRSRGRKKQGGGHGHEHAEEAPARPAAAHPEQTSESSDFAAAWFGTLLELMGIEGKVKGTGDDGRVHLDIVAEGAGRIIGKRGSTLRAIRFFLGEALQAHGNPELAIDVEDSRPKSGKRAERSDKGGSRGREHGRGGRERERHGRPEPKGEYPESKLQALARRAAAKAMDTGKTVTINLALNSYDRRIVHLAVADIEGVYSESEIRDGSKYVQVIPADEE